MDGSKLLLVCTRGASDEGRYYCELCPCDHVPSLSYIARVVSTYFAGMLGYQVFSKDNTQLLDVSKPWETVADLRAYSLFLGVNYLIIMPVGGADLAPGYLTRSNCVYASERSIDLFDTPVPEICRFSLDGDDAVGFSTNTAIKPNENLDVTLANRLVSTPLCFIPSFANALEWSMPGDLVWMKDACSLCRHAGEHSDSEDGEL